MRAGPSPPIHPTRLSLRWGIAFVALFITAEIALSLLLEFNTGSRVLGVVYLVGILAASYLWGLRLGLATVLISGIAFNVFNLEPFGSLTLAENWAWVHMLVFYSTAGLGCMLAALARARTLEADTRRREADLAADLAHLLLRSADPDSVLPVASRRMAQDLRLPGLVIERGAVAPGEGRVSFPLRVNGDPVATLSYPADLAEAVRQRLSNRMLTSIEALLQTASAREAVESALEESRDENRRIAEEQAALRRVATLVARGISATDLCNAVACEMGRILTADYVLVGRYEPGHTTVVGAWSIRDEAEARAIIGTRWPLDVPGVSSRVWRLRRPARMAGYDRVPGQAAEWVRRQGIALSVGCPVLVEGSLWGVVIAFAVGAEKTLDGAEERMLYFTELVATAISNAQARADLAASRARVVAAADESRRRIERNLHDGAQQRLVSLGMALRAAEAHVPAELPELRAQLSSTSDGLTEVLDDLRELSRGLHPAILSKGGLGPALKMLGRRSSIPVELDVGIDRRLPEAVEVAAYFAISEALSNVAKHASASEVRVALRADADNVRLLVRDDGRGGADPALGSGLVGLRDRVEALGGTMEVKSPAGQGTSLSIVIPIHVGDRPSAFSLPVADG
ncbi:sensor histidine kinase [Microtetraspora malaysiensis]|uniref:sensor histidine kinase n=1 Tax=Microtetraspora malaysiensis TaxID=161358 RepID=UPI00082A0616|nr:histidine kinase [Microtetraspora malaysiensis]